MSAIDASGALGEAPRHADAASRRASTVPPGTRPSGPQTAPPATVRPLPKPAIPPVSPQACRRSLRRQAQRPRAAQRGSLSGEVQRELQLECQLADWRGAAVAESRAAQGQPASLKAALLSQAAGLQFQGAAATAAESESSGLDCWSNERHALRIATEQAGALRKSHARRSRRRRPAGGQEHSRRRRTPCRTTSRSASSAQVPSGRGDL